MAKFVVTAVGDDRSGLVAALAAAVADAGGNWLESRMGRLAGKFAGIVLVDAPDASSLQAALGKLGADGVLEVALTSADAPEPTAAGGEPLRVFVLGNDRPGIVKEVSGALASLGVTIEQLDTLTRNAPMGDGLLFEADADVRLPSGVTPDAVRVAIEALAHDIVVDLDADEE
ncbi:glycine cleavage system protein R [Propioniciclava tarda]|uniref:Amino acid-binding ACT protein n=1 Tax=Propioniciclava tarda TaxID=433330 RepID=A0A4Q9KJ19_PROTD|nr:ACT domain-containing protein [Propioniciclava tarda]TBT94422.1 amino acid-binding ACT protein [Propioniciclava tarda]SMO70846.1 Glycine cleavage system regulatory protein [Propioniciclava tarda]